MVRQPKRSYEFGPFRMDATDGLLLRDGQAVPIAPKTYDTLLTLVENSGRVLSKNELMQAVWPDSYVEEANLTHHISALRKALAEGAGGGRYVETVPKRGYRFVAEVRRVRERETAILLEEHTLSSVVVEEETDAPAEVAAQVGAAATQKGLAVGAQDGSARRLARLLLPGLAGTAVFFALAIVAFHLGKSSRAEQPEPREPSMSVVRSIAVLPFKPLSADSRDEALELGMADTLIVRLSSIREINIRPTSAVRKYMSLEQDALAAGRELSVEAVLESSIQRSGDRIRVTSRLKRVVDGAQLWSFQYEDKSTDLFAVQDSISERLAGALELELTGEERKSLTKRYTNNAAAYELYMKGRYFWNKRTEEGVKTAIQYFQQAVDQDQRFALAYSGLADSYIVLGSWRAGGALSPKESMPKAKAAALKALEIDDSLAEAHTSLADVELLYGWDWQTVEKEFKRAIELNPNYATAHQWYANYLAAMGRLGEALEQSKRALEINPLSLIINASIGEKYWFARQYDEAIERCKATLELDQNFAEGHVDLGKYYERTGMYTEAIAEIEKAVSLSEGNPIMIAALGHAYAVSGRRGEAEKVLDELRKRSKQRYVSSYVIATIYVGLDEKDQAFAWLEKAYEERASFLIFLKVDPRLDSLRSDARFADLLRRVGLPQ